MYKSCSNGTSKRTAISSCIALASATLSASNRSFHTHKRSLYSCSSCSSRGTFSIPRALRIFAIFSALTEVSPRSIRLTVDLLLLISCASVSIDIPFASRIWRNLSPSAGLKLFSIMLPPFNFSVFYIFTPKFYDIQCLGCNKCDQKGTGFHGKQLCATPRYLHKWLNQRLLQYYYVFMCIKNINF